MENSKRERERTFQYDEDLPSLPVPSLQQTLQKYLESGKAYFLGMLLGQLPTGDSSPGTG